MVRRGWAIGCLLARGAWSPGPEGSAPPACGRRRSPLCARCALGRCAPGLRPRSGRAGPRRVCVGARVLRTPQATPMWIRLAAPDRVSLGA